MYRITHFKSIIYLFAAMFFLTSCLGENNKTPNDVAKETMISSFAISKVKVVKHGKDKNGNDSIYREDVDVSKNFFSVDHIKGEIYNVDSLPYNTDVTKIKCTIITIGGGAVHIKNIENNDSKNIASLDSLDFTNEREVRVYPFDSKDVYRTYKVKVNVHKQEANGFEWKENSVNEDFKNMQGMKAVACNDMIFVFGNVNGQTLLYTTPTNNTQWTLAQPNFNTVMEANSYKSATVLKNHVYTIVQGQIMRTQNGNEWESKGETKWKQIVGASREYLYAIDNNDKLWKVNENGEIIAEEMFDESISLAPKQDFNVCATPLNTNPEADRVVLIGNRDENVFANDTAAVIWCKIEDYSLNQSTNTPWLYYSNQNNGIYYLPNHANLTVASYANGMIAVGNKGRGSKSAEAFKRIYFSEDGGIIWKQDERFSIPATFDKTTSTFALTVDNQKFVWLICGSTGQVWKAKLNSEGWARK